MPLFSQIMKSRELRQLSENKLYTTYVSISVKCFSYFSVSRLSAQSCLLCRWGCAFDCSHTSEEVWWVAYLWASQHPTNPPAPVHEVPVPAVHDFPDPIPTSGSTGDPIFGSKLPSSSKPSKMKKPCKLPQMFPFTIHGSSLNFLIFLLWICGLAAFPPGTFVCLPQFSNKWQGKRLLEDIFLNHPQMSERPQMLVQQAVTTQ